MEDKLASEELVMMISLSMFYVGLFTLFDVSVSIPGGSEDGGHFGGRVDDDDLSWEFFIGLFVRIQSAPYHLYVVHMYFAFNTEAVYLVEP